MDMFEEMPQRTPLHPIYLDMHNAGDVGQIRVNLPIKTGKDLYITLKVLRHHT